ncbi:MAG: bifunctional sugar-1-phosphate nucleotidylyltransferase/acetyltransferase [Saccharolobus sp.]|uniref:bifunctional sugar-1-phosphate nucleotidylyltransferase/acetyltransferase n=1 Tax=Saccharolobus TaxID=2100760 RepID=UPI001C48520B|nr:bifunctional sugar-1-phosphate nucleotidylyltransferase/acetyltransferase [Saccharolobus shibatae]MCH4814951.1 NTP transferase domain-containing protein [Saccharolobus shibatae]
MKAVVLAAGKGERLEPITHTRPKPFVPVLDTPLILRNIRIVKKYVNDVVIVINSNHKEYFKLIEGVSLVEQTEGKGTAAALRAVKKYLERDDEFLVIYGDLLFEEEAVEKIVNTHGEAILATESDDPKKYGVIVKDSENRLVRIVEKPENPPSKLINAGIYKLTYDIFSYIDKIGLSSRGELELTDAVNLIGNKVKVVTYNGIWLDIGRPWDLIEANKVLLDKEKDRNLGVMEENVKIKGKAIIEDGVVIKSGTYIEGPVYIGKNSVIGPNAYIRPYSVIGSNVKVGAFNEIKESVIMENTKIPHLSYVGDSVICEDVNFGAGTITANLRFDEKEVKVNIKNERVGSGRKKLGAIVGAHVRTGINVSILPGVKIGAYAWIYPGAIVDRDVEKGEKFVPYYLRRSSGT